MAKSKPKAAKIPDFKHTAELIARDAKQIADTKIRAHAEAEVKLFQKRIYRQRFDSFAAIPLAPATIMRKVALRLDLRTMIATGTYVSSIKVFRKVVKGGIEYRIGFAPNTKAMDPTGHATDITLEEVAYVQEHGSAAQHIPARPHWQPHLQELAVRATVVRQRIADAVVKQATRRLRGS